MWSRFPASPPPAPLTDAPEPALPAPAPEPPPAAPRPGLADRLAERRVPQVLGLYAGAATSAVLFVDFLVKRYALSPYLTDALLAAAVLALPAVAVVAYAHGAPGPQRWTRRQVGALAANGALGLGVLAAAFWGKPLGATTQTVTVETAAGETVTRAVARAAFRKRVVVSELEGDADLGRAAGYALAEDLGHDLFVSAWGADVLRRPLREAGFETAAGAPLALLRDAAERVQADALVTGRVERTAGGVRAEATLHPTDGGRPETVTAEGPDVLRVLDDLSARLRASLGLPEDRAADDPTVADALTGSVPALVAWGAGRHADGFADDPEETARQFEAAVGHDSTFARALYDLGGARSALAREAEAVAAYSAAERHRYRLVEADRFALQAVLAVYQQRPDDVLPTVREWAALYPDDTDALHWLVWAYQRAADDDAAIAAAERLAEVDPSPQPLATLAQLYLAEGRFDEALAAAQAFSEQAPRDAVGPRLLSAVQWRMGDLDAAIASIRHAKRLAPTDSQHDVSLGSFLTFAGRWDEAEATYRRAAERAAEPADRALALNQLAHTLDLRGRHRAAAALLDSVWAIRAAYEPTPSLLRSQVGEGYHYVRAGRPEVFEDALRRALAQPEVAGSDYLRASVLSAAAWAFSQSDPPAPARVLRYAATADSLYRAYGEESSRPYLRAVAGIAHAQRGDAARAARAMAPHAAETPTDYFRIVPLAEAYLAAGDAENARAVAEGLLVPFPALPEAHVVLARLDARRDPASARRHLDAALAAWSVADAGFAPARRARALRQRLGR